MFGPSGWIKKAYGSLNKCGLQGTNDMLDYRGPGQSKLPQVDADVIVRTL